MPLALKQFQRAHDHAWGAETALQGVMVAKRRQQRMLGIAGRAQALDRVNRRAVCLDGQDRARLHGAAIQAHRARAALGGVASDVRAGDTEFLAQEVDKQLAGLNLGPPLFTVHRDGDLMT
jgi:hypothetical protein